MFMGVLEQPKKIESLWKGSLQSGFLPLFMFFSLHSCPEIEGTPLPGQQLKNKPGKALFLPVKPG